MDTPLTSVKVGGKEYLMQVKKGIKYIDGLTVDEFIDSLDSNSLIEFAKMGSIFAKNPNLSPSKIMDEFYQSKNN